MADRYFMVLEVVLLALFLLSLGGLANRILAGSMAPYFWVGVVALGILLPLALSIRRGWVRWVNPVAAVLVLAGALVLRAVVVLAAQS
jgi:formate-dependent nitrite reductase membrane component NrfD